MAKKFTESVVRKKVEDDTNHEYSLLHIEDKGKICREKGKAKKRMMTIRHNPCGHIYTLDIYEFMEGKRRCGRCKGKVLREKNAEDIEAIKLKTNILTNYEYSFVDKHYINSKTEHSFLHHTCGTIFTKSWDKFRGTPSQPGQRCTEWYRKGMESTASRYVRDVLDHLYIDFECEKRFPDCINPATGLILPFDYYIPEINTLIEIDGEQHERDSFNKYDHKGTVKRDKIKNKYAEDTGIELIRIPANKWPILPEVLFKVLSKDLIPTLTLEEVKEITHSTHPERINKDLQKMHNGEYTLHDKYYFGIDRNHDFKHLTCGTIFHSTLYYVKTNKYPCPVCRDENISRDKHLESNKKLIEKSKGRYSLNESHIGLDEKGRRLTDCNRCNDSWWVTVGNLMKNKANCPNCFEQKKDREWKFKYDLCVEAINNGSKLNKHQKHWIWWNEKRYEEGKLKIDRVKLLQKANLL